MKKSKIFPDILQEKGTYSQGRLYLFVSIVFYYIIHLIMAFKAFYPDDKTVSVETLTLISEGLYKAMCLFGGYVFGGKFISAYKTINKKNNETDDSE